MEDSIRNFLQQFSNGDHGAHQKGRLRHDNAVDKARGAEFLLLHFLFKILYFSFSSHLESVHIRFEIGAKGLQLGL
jgi:hypothetical protein